LHWLPLLRQIILFMTNGLSFWDFSMRVRLSLKIVLKENFTGGNFMGIEVVVALATSAASAYGSYSQAKSQESIARMNAEKAEFEAKYNAKKAEREGEKLKS